VRSSLAAEFTRLTHVVALEVVLRYLDEMGERAFSLFEQMRRRVLEGAGDLPPEVRSAVAARKNVPEALSLLVEKIHLHAYRVTDEDIAALRESGYSEDQLLELTLAAAVGAADERLRAAMSAAKPRS
jgi:hypothetical protein